MEELCISELGRIVRPRFVTAVAASEAEVREAQRLRYRVFAEEMGASIANANERIDRDEFDPYCEHLVVRNCESGRIVGTYRILTAAQSLHTGGFYSEREFHLDGLAELVPRMVEIGRACVDRDYRNGAVIATLWSGLAHYLWRGGHDYVIGCASVPASDGGRLATSIYRRVRCEHASPLAWRVRPRCPFPFDAGPIDPAPPIPTLLKGYLRLGCVCLRRAGVGRRVQDRGPLAHAPAGADESSLRQPLRAAVVSVMALGVHDAAAVRTARLRTRAKRIAQVMIHTATVWFAALLILPWLDRPRREAAVTRWARRTLRIFNVRVAVRGSPARFAAPVMLVANHISWLDIYVMNALCVSRFVAKSEVASAPVFGTIARQLGSIFIRRGSLRDAHRVKGEAAAALRGGDVVGLFPEGTTSDGTRLQFFYPALFQAAIEAGATTQPIAIRYHQDDGRPNTAPAYTEQISLMQSIRAVLREPMLRAEITFCEPLPAHLTRRELADRARRSIAEALDVCVLPPRPRHMPGASHAAKCRRGFAKPISSEQGGPCAQRPNARVA